MMSWESPWSGAYSTLDRIRTFPAFIIWSMLGFVSGWIQTRKVPSLILGIPALLLAFPVLSLTLHSREQLNTESINRYLVTARDHLKNQRLDQAEFYLNRLKSVSVENDQLLQTRAEFALAKDSPDLAEKAYQTMLTNTDPSLDAQAHRELAILEMKRTPHANTRQASEAIQHLQEALKRHPADLQTHQLLTKLYLQRGDLRSVAQHLEPVARSNPAMQYELARIYQQLGRLSKRDECAKASIDYSRSVIDKMKSQGPLSQQTDVVQSQWVETSLQLSEALSMLGRHGESAETLTRALDRFNSEKLRQQLAKVYLQQAAAISGVDKTWEKRWELVTLSRNYTPDAPEALTLLANIAAHAPRQLQDQAVRELQHYLDHDVAPSSVYFIVGTSAVTNRQWDVAEKFLRRSVELEPRADIAWNNLAYVLFSRPDPDWTAAEHCIEKALLLNSTPATYHETRGHIMAGLSRWLEVIRELELTITEMPATPAIHRDLSAAYAELGDEDLSEYHRARQTATENNIKVN